MIIIFEGVDNVGKTTHILKLAEKIRKDFPDYPVLTFKSPSNTFKEFLKTKPSFERYKRAVKIDSSVFFLNLIKKVYKSYKETGKYPIVLIDRFYDISTYAYRFNETEEEILSFLSELNTIQPDILVYLGSNETTSSDVIYTHADLEKVSERYNRFFTYFKTSNCFTVSMTINKEMPIETNNIFLYDALKIMIDTMKDNRRFRAGKIFNNIYTKRDYL